MIVTDVTHKPVGEILKRPNNYVFYNYFAGIDKLGTLEDIAYYLEKYYPNYLFKLRGVI